VRTVFQHLIYCIWTRCN